MLDRLRSLLAARSTAGGAGIEAVEALQAWIGLDALWQTKDPTEAGLGRGLLQAVRARPGCRLVQLLTQDGREYLARDRFEDADPLPEHIESTLAIWAARRSVLPGETQLLASDQLEAAPPVLKTLASARDVRFIHLHALPAWSPWPAWLLVGWMNTPEASCSEGLAQWAREVAAMFRLCQSRRELESERARVLEEHTRLMVQGFELDRVRRQAERDGDLKLRRVDEAERLKNEFLSSVSHELRTPLNAIQGYTRMVLREPNLTDRQRLSLERVLTSSQNQLKLINNILDYSRLEAGRMRLELESLDLAMILRDVMLQVEPLAAEQGLELRIELPEDPTIRTFSDRSKLEQILVNLLGNAIKFSPRGSIVLRLRAQAGTLSLDVQDTGIGIPPGEQELIFERFRRSSQTEGVRGAAGTGLGLAISRRLGELLGGRLSLVSEPGKGSTFTLTLPQFLDLDTARLALQSTTES